MKTSTMVNYVTSKEVNGRDRNPSTGVTYGSGSMGPVSMNTPSPVDGEECEECTMEVDRLS